MATNRKATQLARQLFKLSFEGDQISSDRVTGVLEWVDKTRPSDATSVLRNYKHLVEDEMARHRAVIEFAGALELDSFQKIAEAMSKRYDRKIEAVPVAKPELIAGVRVRVGCDIYENSIVSQLEALSNAS